METDKKQQPAGTGETSGKEIAEEPEMAEKSQNLNTEPMETKNPQKAKAAVKRAGRVYIVWALLAGLCFVILSGLYTLIWRDRIDYGRLDECQLIADTAMLYSNADAALTSDFKSKDKEGLVDLAVVTGWGAACGDLQEEQLRGFFLDTDWNLEELSVTRNGRYRAVVGDLTQEDYLSAIKKMENEDRTDFDASLLGRVMVETVGEDSIRVSAKYEETGAQMLVRISGVTQLSGLSEDEDPDLDEMLDRCMIPESGGLICIDLSDKTVAGVRGNISVSVGDKLERIPTAEGFLFIGRKKCIAAYADTDKYRFIACIPAGQSKSLKVISPLTLAAWFTLLFVFIVLYAWFLRNDFAAGRIDTGLSENKKVFFLQLFRRRIRVMFFSLGVGAGLIASLGMALSIVDHSRLRMRGLLEDTRSFFLEAAAAESFVESTEDNTNLMLADRINQAIGFNPSLIVYGALHDLAAAISCGVYVIDRDGSVAEGAGAGDYRYSKYDFSGLNRVGGDDSSEEEGEEETGWESLHQVLVGESDGQSAEITMDDCPYNGYAVQRIDSPGMILLLNLYGDTTVTDELFSSFNVTEGRIIFAVSSRSGEIISCSDEQYNLMDAEAFGVTEEALQDGFAGEVSLTAGNYFLVTESYKSILTCMGVSVPYMVSTYLIVVLLTVIAGIVMAGLFLVVVLLMQKKDWNIPGYHFPRRKKHKGVWIGADVPGEDPDSGEGDEAFYSHNQGKLNEHIPVHERWGIIILPFRERTADQKLSHLLGLLYFLAVLCFYLISRNDRINDPLSGTISFLLSKQWVSGINVYGVTYALFIVGHILILSYMLRFIVMLIGSNFSSRGETMARLIESFISYAAVIGAIAYSMTFLGVDTATILASVGIGGLALGLGAKDLITDILAGIGIVFEGEFQAGDIIEINGYRGRVIEIGIRTTKVLSDSNVKIFRNSMVSGVINMTARYSFAEVRIQVARSEPLEKVEEIFRKELPVIRRRIPEMGDDIRMPGVVEMTPDCVTLSITANCEEKNRKKVMRALYREINLMMAREGLKPKG